MAGPYGSDSYGSSPYGSSPDPFRVTGAVAQSSTLVEVIFSHPLDPSFAPFTVPGNYDIPGLTVLAAVRGAMSVLLTTSPQSAIAYTVTVQSARDQLSRPLVPWGRVATFNGLLNPAGVEIVATGPERVRAIFTEPVLLSPDLTNPASYAITTADGTPLPIASVVPEQPGNPRSVVLILSVSLIPTTVYVATLESVIVTPDGREVAPKAQDFQWIPQARRADVELARFSGESTGGLLGQHAGLVFFSPALLAPVAASTIQVEEVSVCTKAYDSYHLPAPVDPPALFTWSEGAPVVGLGDGVLWGGPGVLTEARIELVNRVADTMPLAEDGRCVATLEEPFDVTYLSYLNNPYWALNGDGGALFICADNGAPIPPGPTTVITLVP